jgi:hypothetical protein
MKEWDYIELKLSRLHLKLEPEMILDEGRESRLLLPYQVEL